ncbi:peptidase M15B and M15C DD-carboxypeptidase VanY/endolysin [Limnospira maxima CS-328]|uniref:Peptidase M15B and M15C DD-carboxypeptidase VanY/endolysin n=2 Tax=Sirenicapillariaceae TaxID=2934961 RepID=B5W1E0_LIMMA|nr:peptidase M15B and M15C DD-carboxypeptidase VanY/endolysin [Limnospira maxima CS-328]
MYKNLDNVPPMTSEDIPEAIRDTPNSDHSTLGKSQRSPKFWQWFALGIVAFVVALGLNYQFGILVVDRTSVNLSASETTDAMQPPPTTNPLPTPSVIPNQVSQLPVNLLGHLPYEEAPESELKNITADGVIRLRRAAAYAFLDMTDAARRSGIILVPISGFRGLEDQEFLFFDIKAQRGQVPSQRAQVSAPPGYSEHHTGYAIDVGDANFPDTDLRETFDQTPAFKWLVDNAAFYSFELSFPKDNPLGVSYEPWHWRYVGDRHSLETFYKARSIDVASPSDLVNGDN